MPLSDKHLLNSPSSLVLDSLVGLCALNPKLALDVSNKVVYQVNPDPNNVALICGGGSGHEPAHAGFVGSGMLTAAICGNIFASPNAGQVRRGIDLVDNEKGTIIIVKNYTGDVLNFGLAKEHYAAAQFHKADRVKFVVVGDDVSVGKTQGSIVGRRGLAGTVLVYKIAGALARQGANLDEVHSLAQWVASRIGTVGVGLEHCHVPGTESSASHLNNNEVEIGMGIHNEPGHKRLSPIPPLHTVITQLIELITNTSDPERSFLPFKNNNASSADEVIVLLNNLGGLSELELCGIAGTVIQVLNEKKVKIHRLVSGTFMTSLNMPGFSLTLLLLPGPSETNAPSASHILSLLDEGVDTSGWKWSSTQPPQVPSAVAQVVEASNTISPVTQVLPALGAPNVEAFVLAIDRACKGLIAAEPEITRMDSIAGDGDCGLTLKSGAEAVLREISLGKIKGDDVIGAVVTISKVTAEHMDGTSGALYSIFFSALAQGLLTAAHGSNEVSDLWVSALDAALTRLYTYTRARPPSRTLVDPLAAFVQSLLSSPVEFVVAVEAARNAAEATRDIEAKAGRSAYIDSEQLKKERIPDPGAWGVKVILEGLFM